MEINEIPPLLIETVDISRYKAAERKIRHVFHGASKELVAMVINFAHSPELGVPGGHNTGWEKRKAALDTLLEGGYVKLLYGHWHDMAGGKGRCCIYRRTDLFERTFSFRLPLRLVVAESALVSTITSAYEPGPTAHNRIKVNSIPALSTYAKLVDGIKLSLSNKGQVFRKVVLNRIDGRRIYASGVYNYQNIPKEERPYLQIDGESVVELDFSAMHGNLLLNGVGEPCRIDFYERILRELGATPTDEKRGAAKTLTLATFNAEKRTYGLALSGATDDGGKRLVEVLGVRPRQVKDAILKAYPMLAPYVCTGDHSDWLQTTDSGIMIDVLETLATMGVVGLPLHDSVIAPAKYADSVKQVMLDCYKRKMGFEPYVK